MKDAIRSNGGSLYISDQPHFTNNLNYIKLIVIPECIKNDWRDNRMKKLLKLAKNDRWDLEGIAFAIEERVGEPENFIGRIKELEFLYNWADNIRKKISRSIAFLGRRKIGKSLILERLYNIIYS